VWDLTKGTEKHRLKGHADTIHCLAVSPDGRRLAAGAADGMARVWDLDKPAAAALNLRGRTAVVSIAFLYAGKALLTASPDGVVRVWDAANGAQRGFFTAPVGRLHAVAFAGVTKRFALAGDSLHLRKPDGSFTLLSGHRGPVLCVAFAADGARLLSGGVDGTVRLWRVEDGEEVHCFMGHTGAVRGVALHPDGRAGYSCGADGTMRLWPLPG
jgi:WD40 repeat protein